MSKTEFTIKRLTLDDLEQELREFERVHRHTTGEDLTSEDFFARFCQGEFDTPFGMEWADYWRAYVHARS
jgi:hypothetical protein